MIRKTWLSLGVGILLAMVLFGLVVFPQSPSIVKAAGGGDVNWNLNAGARGYIAMINAVRARVRWGYVYGDTREAQPSSSASYFNINIHLNQGTADAASVSLRMRTDNLYLEGWTANDYYYHFNGVPGKAGATNVLLPVAENYGSLQAVAGLNNRKVRIG